MTDRSPMLSGAPAWSEPLLIEGTTVLDPARADAAPRQSVLIERGRIVRVASDDGPRPAAARIDGSGAYLLPGLWDMHHHIYPRAERWAFPLFIALGITGIRDMSRSMDLIHRWRAVIASGAVAGPRIVGCGGIVDGEISVRPFPELRIGDADGARQVVRDLVEAGADFVKIYPSLTREAFLALVDEATRLRRDVCGHVPLEVGVAECSDAGLRTIEHLDGFLLAVANEEEALRRRLLSVSTEITQPFPDSFYPEAKADSHLERLAATLEAHQRSGYTAAVQDVSRRALETTSPRKRTALIEKLARNATWQCPTLYSQHVAAGRPPATASPDDARYTPRSLRTSARRDPGLATTSALHREIVGEMQRAHMPLLAGTDTGPYPDVIPAVALHEELQLLVLAGLTPAQALSAATSAPARSLNAENEIGAVAPGRLADLVLLDADPFADISNTRRIRAVIVAGRPHDRRVLDDMLERAAEECEGL